MASLNWNVKCEVDTWCQKLHTKEYQIVDSSTLSIPSISETEKKYQELWTVFFKTIAIKERKNSRLQMQYMPKKYWKDLIELKQK